MTLRRLAVEVDEQRNPRTTATVEQLLTEHFELLEVEPSTLSMYRTLARAHIMPLIGRQKVGAVSDSFYAELRRRRAHCAAGPSSSTGPRACTTATTAAARTAAAAYPGRRSGRSTSSSAAP